MELETCWMEAHAAYIEPGLNQSGGVCPKRSHLVKLGKTTTIHTYIFAVILASAQKKKEREEGLKEFVF